MGQEINTRHFTAKDFESFQQRLAEETEILAGWFEHQQLSSRGLVAGYEMEAWLIDQQAKPAASCKSTLSGNRQLRTVNHRTGPV